jgi:O-Antigen ligase
MAEGTGPGNAPTVATLAAVSSLAPARGRATPGSSPAAPEALSPRRPARINALLGVGLAAGLALVAFLTKGGVDVGPDTWVQIVLTLLGVGLAIAILIVGAPGRLWGGVTLTSFVALVALTATSIAWAVQPDTSWLEANRTVSYLAVFAGALALARLFPERWPAIVSGVALVAVALSAYALLVKVFPATFDPQGSLVRLHTPFDYWNATGLMAVLGLPGCLWAGARRRRPRIVGALVVPSIAILLTVVILSYSRSALLAAVVATGCWFALVPLRLRGALILALGAAAAAILSVWSLSTRALSHDFVGLSARTSAGRTFGLVAIAVLISSALAGWAAASAIDRTTVSLRTRRRIGTVLIVLVALIPVGGIGVLAASSRGLTGEISHAWHTLTSQQAVVFNNPNRLVELGSSRARDWSEGFKVGEHALLGGVGARGFGVARKRYSTSPSPVQDAHSYVVQTFADLGLAGVAISLALLIAWALAARRTLAAPDPPPTTAAPDPPPTTAAPDPPPTTAAPDRPPTAPFQPEREGLLTLLCVVIAFGVHSAIDWTWFIPGTALPALISAGWLAGRGPLAAPVGRLPQRRRLLSNPATGAAVTVLVAVALIGAWAIWQPLRSTDAYAAALTADGRGDVKAAFADARTAATRDPVSIDPLFELAALYGTIGEGSAARAELVKATGVQPENPASWLQLGYFDLRRGRPRRALREFERARVLDRSSPLVAQAIAGAHRAATRRAQARRIHQRRVNAGHARAAAAAAAAARKRHARRSGRTRTLGAPA